MKHVNGEPVLHSNWSFSTDVKLEMASNKKEKRDRQAQASASTAPPPRRRGRSAGSTNAPTADELDDMWEEAQEHM